MIRTLKPFGPLANARADGGHKIDRITIVPVDPRPRQVTTQVRMVNRLQSDPMSQAMGLAFGRPDSSLLIMRLVLEDSRVGTVTLRADGTDAYSDEHRHLFSLLNEPSK